ncbi:hypothetical protein Gohar_005872 [Gossypium harknessii]|uniref:Transmembrane protein n=1 Tax=Gossypium harknessii TaxID=34285 RepID=A0A7J9H9W5_9ROSI|nr:hypothetical protein [Gossypium harknessii]
MLPFFQLYSNLILQTLFSLSLTLVLTFLKIPVFFLQGLHTYIHPDNVAGHHGGPASSSSGVRAAIRRPSDSGSGLDGYQSLSSRTNTELKKKNKSKDKFEFDENNAQIFRLKLDEDHLQTRLFYNDYHNSFVFSFVGISCLLLYKYLGYKQDSGVLANGDLIPIIFGFIGLIKAFSSLAKISFEKSGSKRSEKQFSAIFGVLGFILGIIICSGIGPLVFDFHFDSIEGSWRIFVSILMGFIAGSLYMPAGKNARSFWLGTDQLRCNLSIISCGWFSRLILYANYILTVFTALLWINPFVEILSFVSFSRSEFTRFRLLCLLLSGVLQIVSLRSNLQMFLNEAVLSWYQRLHASKVPDLDFSRAKVFLHNHYLCLAVVQFFAPSVSLLLFLGLSQIDTNSFDKYNLVKEVAVFMAWWIVFIWAVITSASLVFYRRGILYVF